MPVSPLMNAEGAVDVRVTLDDRVTLEGHKVRSVEVRKEIGVIPEAKVVVALNDYPTGGAPELGGTVIKLGMQVGIEALYRSGDGPGSLFTGVIVAMRFRIDSLADARLELVCRDEAAALLELRSSSHYTDQKDSDVMSAIIGDAGLTAAVETTQGANGMQLRFASSDWNYLKLLADRNGLVLIADGGTVSAKAPQLDAEAPLIVTLGVDLIEMDAVVDAQRSIATATIDAWDSQQQAMVTGTSSAQPATAFGNTTLAAIAEVLGGRTRHDSTAGEFAAADLGVMATARMMRAGLAAVSGRCTFQGSALILPGDTLEIGGVGAMFNGKAYVSGVSHTLRAGEWRTEATLGLPQDWATDRLSGLAAAGGITMPHVGLQIGKVLSIAKDPDGKQRIEVKLPMVGAAPAEIWARFAQPYASADVGIQFMPEVGDEVVVGFLSADPNAAVVLGALHNGVAAQPIAPEAANNLKAIVTREKLRIDFDDEKKILTLSTPGGHSVKLDDDAKELTLVDMNGNSATFSASGIAIKSDKDISITASGKIDVTATQDTTVKGMNVTCNGSTGFTGKGGATSELSAGGQTTVKGAMVMIN